MIGRHEPDIALLEPATPKPADPLIGLQHRLSGTASQEYHDLGLQQMHLHPQVRQTSPDLFSIGGTVARRSTLYYIEDKNVLKPQKTAGCQDLIQELSRTTDEGPAQPVLICSRPLPAEDQSRLRIAFPKNDLTASTPQGTALTRLDDVSELFEVSCPSQSF